MKITYDREVDALSIIFNETTVTTKHISDSISIDYDSSGNIARIEILEAAKSFGNTSIFNKIEFENLSFIYS